MGMFTACFDASGHEKEHNFIVVAGFISYASEWITFSEQWKDRITRDGLAYFRASECQNFTRQFKTWKDDPDREKRRLKLWNDLLDIIERSSFRKFVVILHIKPYQSRLSERTKKALSLNAFVIGARTCVSKVREWAKREHISTPIEYVFEEGDEGWGLLEQRFHDDGLPMPISRPKQDVVKDGQLERAAFLPLQASDFLAYEYFIREKIRRKNREPSNERPIHRFEAMVAQPWVYEGHSMARLAAMCDAIVAGTPSELLKRKIRKPKTRQKQGL